jgi:acyl-coenzyme A synthetase/AMP-(fatty) acid ligase
MHKYDLSSLKHLFLAGEPLDQPTHEWIMGELGKPVIDNYWQTETGWPILVSDAGHREDGDPLRHTELPGLWLQPQGLSRGRHDVRAG